MAVHRPQGSGAHDGDQSPFHQSLEENGGGTALRAVVHAMVTSLFSPALWIFMMVPPNSHGGARAVHRPTHGGAHRSLWWLPHSFSSLSGPLLYRV